MKKSTFVIAASVAAGKGRTMDASQTFKLKS